MNNQGIGLVQALIIGGIILILISSFAAYQFQRNKEIRAQDTRAVYNQLQKNLKAGASQTHSLTKSEELGSDKL